MFMDCSFDRSLFYIIRVIGFEALCFTKIFSVSSERCSYPSKVEDLLRVGVRSALGRGGGLEGDFTGSISPFLFLRFL